MTSLLNKFKKLLYFLGRRTAIWLFVSVVAGTLAGFSDLAIGVLIQALLLSLKVIDADTPLFGKEFVEYFSSPSLFFIGFLGAIGLKTLAVFFSYQSAAHAHELLSARLRTITLYDLLFSKKFVSAAESNTQVGEIFPKAAQFAQCAALCLPALIQMSILFAGMFFAAWQAAAVSLLLILGVGFLIWWLNRFVRRAGEKIPDEQKSLVSGIERIARNWLLIRILRTTFLERDQTQNHIIQYLRHSIRAYFWGHFASSLPVLAGGLVLVVLLVLNVTFFHTPGVILLSFFYLLMRFTQALSSFAQLLGYVSNFFPRFKMALNYFFSFSVDQLDEALHPKKLPLNLDAEQIANSIRDAAPRIEVKNISFRYSEKSHFVFKDFGLNIDAGESIGIVGQSGSGKSTLLALILGVIDPEEGQILLDGKAPADYFKNSRAKVGYVGAEAFLIEGSIKENLSYGLGYLASETACWEALKKARLDEVILSKAEKLDFRLKENGEGLSAGQKQRLALARSFLAKPQILILDEASANLDEKTEKEIVESLSALEHSSTVIIVSHRPGILKKASRLINLESPHNIESFKDGPTQMMHSLI